MSPPAANPRIFRRFSAARGCGTCPALCVGQDRDGL